MTYILSLYQKDNKIKVTFLFFKQVDSKIGIPFILAIVDNKIDIPFILAIVDNKIDIPLNVATVYDEVDRTIYRY